MYKIEIEKVIEKIKSSKSKEVALQLPDGMKGDASKIVDEIEKKTDANAYIWFGGCFGACDIPKGLDSMGIELLIQWGHNKFRKEFW